MKAYELLEKGFCHLYYAIDAAGDSLDFRDKDAVAWCTEGAIRKLYLNASDLEDAYFKLRQKIGRTSIVAWNDSATKETVVNTLKELDI